MTGRRSVKGANQPDAPTEPRITGAGPTVAAFDPAGELASLARLAVRISGADHVVICLDSDGRVEVLGRAAKDACPLIWTPPANSGFVAQTVPVRADLPSDRRLAPFQAARVTPIVLDDGTRIGSLWALWIDPHLLPEDATAGLDDVAATAAQLLQSRNPVPSSADQGLDAMIANFIDHAPVALALVDRSLRYVRVSPRWLEELKLVGTPVIGRHIDEVFPGALAVWGNIYGRCLEGESFRNDAVEARDGQGNPC